MSNAVGNVQGKVYYVSNNQGARHGGAAVGGHDSGIAIASAGHSDGSSLVGSLVQSGVNYVKGATTGFVKELAVGMFCEKDANGQNQFSLWQTAKSIALAGGVIALIAASGPAAPFLIAGMGAVGAAIAAPKVLNDVGSMAVAYANDDYHKAEELAFQGGVHSMELASSAVAVGAGLKGIQAANAARAATAATEATELATVTTQAAADARTAQVATKATLDGAKTTADAAKAAADAKRAEVATWFNDQKTTYGRVKPDGKVDMAAIRADAPAKAYWDALRGDLKALKHDELVTQQAYQQAGEANLKAIGNIGRADTQATGAAEYVTYTADKAKAAKDTADATNSFTAFRHPIDTTKATARELVRGSNYKGVKNALGEFADDVAGTSFQKTAQAKEALKTEQAAYDAAVKDVKTAKEALAKNTDGAMKQALTDDVKNAQIKADAVKDTTLKSAKADVSKARREELKDNGWEVAENFFTKAGERTADFFKPVTSTTTTAVRNPAFNNTVQRRSLLALPPLETAEVSAEGAGRHGAVVPHGGAANQAAAAGYRPNVANGSAGRLMPNGSGGFTLVSSGGGGFHS